MCDASKIVKQRQLAIRRELNRRGIALKAIAFDTNLSYSTLASYFPENPNVEPVQMPTGVLFALCGHVPDDLLSLMLPDGRQIVQAPDDIDHDALCDLARDYVDAKVAAHRADSPGGCTITDDERQVLNRKVTPLCARAA